jgi:hypothetical protein
MNTETLRRYIVLIPGRADPAAPLVVRAQDAQDAKREGCRIERLPAIPAGVVAVKIAEREQ